MSPSVVEMSQTELQNSLWQQRGNLQVKAELSNVLYERELKRLANDNRLSLDALKKQLVALPYYVGRAADKICNTYSPLDLDSSNASWLYKQSPKPFSVKQESVKTAEFYGSKAKVALVVPISINLYGFEYVALDTVDEVDSLNQKLHCNQHGWFSFGGQSDVTDVAKNKLLLKPSKAVFAAACCGHQWKNAHKTISRALSLRELLLATQINWSNFGKLVAISRD